MKKYSLSHLASLLKAELVLRDTDLEVVGVAPFEKAKREHITFLSSAKYQKFLSQVQAGAVLITAEFAKDCPVNTLIVKDPYVAFAKVAALFDEKSALVPGVHATALIDRDVVVPSSCSIGPYVVIKKGVRLGESVSIASHCVIDEDCVVGDQTELKAHVTLYSKVRLGKRCIIHSGVVLGSDGFGLANDNGVWLKIPQTGGVLIGDDVEIGANTTIDRGALEDTIIGHNVKIDNQVQIAHNVIIGDSTAMAAQVGIAGSTQIGRYCLLGGKVGVNGHIKIGDQIVVTAMSGVSRDLSEKGIYSASIPARPVVEWNKTMARLNRLDKLIEKVKVLAKHLGMKE